MMTCRDWLLMEKSLTAFMACCKGVLSDRMSTMTTDHETFRRLMLAAEHRGIGKDPQTTLARMIGSHVATVSNWRKRGVSAPAAIELSKHLRVDAGWLMAVDGSPVPDFISYEAPTESVSRLVAERRGAYHLTSDEQVLMDGFRVGEPWAKRSMLVLAQTALIEHGRRSSNGKHEKERG